MSETDVYYQYNHERVLLETSRIYNPEFAPAVVQLTGAQVEMLRNMTQYLNRPNTYVEEYEFYRYLTPDAGQFDDIQAIVADLEEKLMGNENVLWGYSEHLNIKQQWTTLGAGDSVLTSAPVPEGYIYVLQSVSSRNQDTECTQLTELIGDTAIIPIGADISYLANKYNIINNQGMVMQEGDRVRCTFYDCLLGDTVELYMWGYKMAVP